MADAVKDIAEIRSILKSFMPKVSVRKGRGTGWGWVEVRGGGPNGHFTAAEKATMTLLELPYGANYSVISPKDRAAVLDGLRRSAALARSGHDTKLEETDEKW